MSKIILILACHIYVVVYVAGFNFKYRSEGTKAINCLWYNNSCVDRCPENMVQKYPNCSSTVWISQLTCEHPEPIYVSVVCGFARCDCPNGKYWEPITGFCYDLDNCPTQHSVLL